MTRAHLPGILAMAAIVLASNILVQFLFGQWLTWGAFTYPLAFLVTDLMNRLYGAGPARQVVFVGALIYALAMFLMTEVGGPPGLLLVLGLLTGAAQSATTFVVVLGAVGRVVPAHRRTAAFGVVTALGSFGLFAMVPWANHWLLNGGWDWAFEALAWTALVMVFAALFLPSDLPGDHGHGPGLGALLRAASGHRGYLLLIGGFFVCGFHVAFIATHLPAYAVDMGLDRITAGHALALIGLFNIAGAMLFGWLGDRYRKKYLLSWLYALRAVVIGGFLVIPLTEATALLFGVLIGVIWLGTVPLASGMVGQVFGARYLGTLYGVVFLGHQLGAFLGAWWAGRMFEASGSYDAVWWTSVALGVMAAAIHVLIADRKADLIAVPRSA